jgi:hypothetical protein
MDINLFYIFILICTGVAVGFTTGLLGIGGGFLMVPILYFLFLNLGIEPTLAIRTAFGTSLAIIIPTAISSAIAHNREKQVEVKVSLYIGGAGFTGALLGGYIASNTPGDILRVIFALVLLIVALRMFLFKEKETSVNKKESVLIFLVIGFITGIMSGLVGVGGGIILIPALIFLLGYGIRYAGGTSSAVIILTSLGGIISYIINGISVTGLPAYSLGYVNVLALFVIAVFSIPMAQIGSIVSRKVPENILRYIFIVVMVFISLQMLGVFKWLGISI